MKKIIADLIDKTPSKLSEKRAKTDTLLSNFLRKNAILGGFFCQRIPGIRRIMQTCVEREEEKIRKRLLNNERP